MALGNWVNTPTPANDPGAAASVGNDGWLTLESTRGSHRFALQSATLHSLESRDFLVLEGEAWQDEAQFALFVELPNRDLNKLEGQSFELLGHLPSRNLESRIRHEADGDFDAVSSGTMKINNVTGNGPWEVDCSLEINTTSGMTEASLEGKVREV